MISSRDLTAMPDLERFRRIVRSLAALDAVMSPEWAYRYYSFDPAWGEGEMMASMRNGSGDHWFAIICGAGVAIVGLAHESPSYRVNEPHPAVFAGLPVAFKQNLLEEPAFEASNATFCMWRLREDAQWSSGASTGQQLPENDGSAELLAFLEGRPEQYLSFCEDYFEQQVELADVAAFYDHRPLSTDVVARLNSEADVETVAAELKEMGFPEPPLSPLTATS